MKLEGICDRISRDLKIDKKSVRIIASEIFDEILAVLETEEPVSIRGFGEFYFDYHKVRFHDELRRKVPQFRYASTSRERLEKVDNYIGIETSITRGYSSSLKRLGIEASDIPKMREEINKVNLDSELRLKRFNDVTLDEIASNLSFIIEKM